MDLNLTKDRIKELFAVKKNRRAVLIVWLVFLAILAFLAFKPKTNFKQLSLEPLQDLPSSSKLEGQDLYSFNGLGFTKTNISTGEQEVLSSGYRLPRINNIVWAGDEGALLSFEGSFYYTKVQDELKTVGLNIDEITKKFTWYLNFKDGSLKKVEDVRARKNLGYYDPNNKKLVFLPNESERVESAGNFYSLEILDITSLKTSTVDLKDVVAVPWLQSCSSDSSVVCFSQTLKNGQKSFMQVELKNGDKKELISNIDFDLVPSTDKNIYLTKLKEEPKKDTKTLSNEELELQSGDSTEGPAALYFKDSNQYVELGFKTNLANTFVLVKDDDILITDGYMQKPVEEESKSGQEEVKYRSVKLNKKDAAKISAKSKELELKVESSTERRPVLSIGSNSNGTDIFSGFRRHFAAAGFSGEVQINSRLIQDLDLEKLKEETRSCLVGGSQSSLEQVGGEIRVYYADTPSLAAEVSKTQDCLTKLQSYSAIYPFQSFVRDAKSGRIVSD